MKNAIILHGTGDKPTDFWFPWLKERLEAKGYEVWLPELPNAEKPNLKDWVPFILKGGKFSEETIMIGHSAGAQIIPSVLEKLDVKIKQAILVSGYGKALRQNDKSPKNVDDYEWENIKGKAKEFIFINSDNDPWTCDDKQGRILFDNLGGIQIILHEGHMGSTTHKQPYKEFPLLNKLID
ncbi:MAG: alpha/beta hydrolase [Candidatus Staskawiczbacteria bacterium]|nr:alpha/beta hydrolase [Candidatus Staskawiczbacteria bacterium]